MPDHSKNLLIISYYFPPMGMGGVQRAFCTAKYMAALGWNVQVIAGGDDNYPLRDNSLLRGLPEKVTIHWVEDPLTGVSKSSAKNSFVIRGKPGFLQRLIRLPDSKIFWAQKAQVLAEKLLAGGNIKHLLTSSPPPSLNKIGLRLKRKFKIKWIADFRDPWFADEFPPLTPIHALIRDRLESSTVAEADFIVSVTANHADDLRRRFSSVAHKVTHIPNGFDPADFIKIRQSVSQKLIFAHCGTLCDFDGVNIFFAALSKLMAADDSLRDLIEFHQIGAVHAELRKMLDVQFSNMIKIDYSGYLDHTAALAKLAQSSVILVFGGMHRHNPMIVPGKLYEGLAFSKPLAAVAEKDSAVAGVIGELPGCYRLDPDDPGRIESALGELIEDFRRGKLFDQSRGALIEKYSREFQTRQFAKLLEA